MIDRLLEAIGDDKRTTESETVVQVAVDGTFSAVLVPEPMEAPEVVAAVQVSLWKAVGMEAEAFDRATCVMIDCLHELAKNPDEWARYRSAYAALVAKWRA